MKVVSSIEFSILDDGNYLLNRMIVYHSPRYNKTITVPAGYISDGATGAMDIASRAWFVHDMLCERGKWDDGTKLSNWQCSQVLQDILEDEGRYWQAKRWFWATWFFGGGEARKNGMLTVAMVLLCLTLSACSYNSVTITAMGNVDCSASADKTQNLDPDIMTGDNQIPLIP